jgi:hypothetical protein
MSGEVLKADQPASELDSAEDREELKARYYGLIQELRVLLPGVQVLVAFLLTVPFAARFDALDRFGRIVFGASLMAGMFAVVVLMAPTALHRFGDRRDRVQRLDISVQLCRIGIGLFGLSLLGALVVVVSYLYGPVVSVLLPLSIAVAMAGLWIVLPTVTRRDGRR